MNSHSHITTMYSQFSNLKRLFWCKAIQQRCHGSEKKEKVYTRIGLQGPKCFKHSCIPTLHSCLRNHIRTWSATHLLPGVQKPPYTGCGPSQCPRGKWLWLPGASTGLVCAYGQILTRTWAFSTRTSGDTLCSKMTWSKPHFSIH